MQQLINRTNFDLINKFLSYENITKNHSEKTMKRYFSYLKHLLWWAFDVPFLNVHNKDPNFIKYLENRISSKTQKPLSRESWKKILGLTSRLFKWAKENYPKDFKAFPQIWIDSLVIPKNIPESDDRTYVTIDETLQLAALDIPENDLALRRDQAAAAMLFISGMRASAFVTLPIKAVNIIGRSIKQWTILGVETKNGKSATTFIYEIEELLEVVNKWDTFLRDQLPDSSPWYAPIKNNWGEQELSSEPPGKNRNQILNKRLRILFNRAKLPYRSAHKFRRGNLIHGLNHARTIDNYKAISENLMHNNITITDQYYGKFSDKDRRTKISELFNHNDSPKSKEDQLIEKLVDTLKEDFYIKPKDNTGLKNDKKS
jgi:integrase